MTEKSTKYCSCILSNVLTDTKILNYRTDNFPKSPKSLFLQLVTSKTQINFFRSAPTQQNQFSDRGYYFSIPLHNFLMLHFLAVLCNVWEGLPNLTSHLLSTSYFDEFIFFSDPLRFIDDSNCCFHIKKIVILNIQQLSSILLLKNLL